MLVMIIIIALTIVGVCILFLGILGAEPAEPPVLEADPEENRQDTDAAAAEEESPAPIEEPETADIVAEPDNSPADAKDAPPPVITESTPYTSDKLTGLKTGRGYLLDCKNALEYAREESHIYCACYFDFDRFNYINNLKGASSGDFVLIGSAQQIRDIFPKTALISRISCDHFIIMFPLTDLALLDVYYEKLRHMCEKIKQDIAVKSSMRVSVGFATTDDADDYDVNVLMTRANAARHFSKVTKSDKYEIYDESMITSNFYDDSLMENYSQCQYGDDIAHYFEMITNVDTERTFGCDTLARWACEDSILNVINADNGHIPTNNDKLIYQACRSISRLRKASRAMPVVFVDLVVTDFFKVDLDDFFIKCFSEFQIEPGLVAVKIDASIIRLDWSMCSKQIKKLSKIGVKTCVCGVDTSCMNFEFLSGLVIDYIKLHKSFAEKVDMSADQQYKCSKVLERAAPVDAQIIFEGVDTIDQAKALQKLGARYVQGRYSGKIATTDDLIRALPESVERHASGHTVVLNDDELSKGNFTIF